MNIISKITFAAAAAVISVGAAVSFASPANASSMFDQCKKGRSSGAVESCCNTWLKSHGRPMWMIEGTSCKEAVYCSGKRETKNYGCNLQMPEGKYKSEGINLRKSG